MKQLPEFPERYWQKFSQQPVTLMPFDISSKQIANDYIVVLKQLTSSFRIENIYHRGSTSLEIAGKGDIEIGVIPAKDYWFETIVFLANHYHGLGNLDKEYCRFNTTIQNFDIEIILMKGYTAKLDKKIHEFLAANQSLLKEYELLKYKFAFSKREYNRNKDIFFRRVIAMIPD